MFILQRFFSCVFLYIYEVQYKMQSHQIFLLQLLDVFGHKSNISLVFDFMETDLEVKYGFWLSIFKSVFS